jgi:hypothetical protein
MRGTLLAAAVVLLAAGCGGPTMADPEEARSVLTAALDAWKEGRPADSVRAAGGPVVVADRAWAAGRKLTRYELTGPDGPAGFDRRFPAKIWLADAGGKEAPETVVYVVGVRPRAVVVREER